MLSGAKVGVELGSGSTFLGRVGRAQGSTFPGCPPWDFVVLQLKSKVGVGLGR